MTTAERVREEMARFEAALPDLLQTARGKWVVFRDGRIVSIHDDARTAYEEGLRRFGPTGGHVVAPVEETRTIPITALVEFLPHE
jgi:hypothetical protein